jgi:hypothetical protein
VLRRCRSLSVIGLAALAFVAGVTLVAVFALGSTPSAAQDAGLDLLQPSLNGNPNNPPSFVRPRGSATLPPDQAPPPGRFTAPSRIGATPVYGSPTGFGAGNTGFDSTNARRKQQARVPDQGSTLGPPPETTFEAVAAPPPQVSSQPPILPPPLPPEIYPASAASRPGAILPPPQVQLPISNPPAEVHPLSAANRHGAVLSIPPAIDYSASTPTPGTPQPNILPLGTVPQQALPIAAGDPYEALGIKIGSFLILPAIELSTGYDGNPQHAAAGGPGSVYYVVAPELHVRSDWSRHSLTADITSSYTEYGNDQFTPSLNHPFLNAKVDGRVDVTRDTQILLEGRTIISTDNPGSPNIQAGLSKLPIDTTIGGTLGVAQQLSRFDVSLKGTIDRSMYQNSELTDGESVSNDYRNFNQYAGILRVGYEIDPGFKPFVEVSEDTRIHDAIDPFGADRDSNGASAKIGGAFNVFGSLTGEMAIGYMLRDYHDPTLPNISGATLDGSLIWQATQLTTAKFTAATSVGESILQDVSGAFSRDFNVEVDHAFRTWLIGTAQVGYGRDEYIGEARDDNRYFASIGAIYKLNREMQLKAQLRHDWLTSSQPGNAYESTSVLLTLRLQR